MSWQIRIQRVIPESTELAVFAGSVVLSLGFIGCVSSNEESEARSRQVRPGQILAAGQPSTNQNLSLNLPESGIHFQPGLRRDVARAK